MSDIKKWNESATFNNSAPPDGFPEGMAPSAVNDAAREVMAAVKRWYNDAEWREFDHSATLAGGNRFTINGADDYTSIYHIGRRVRATGPTTWYGTVSSSSFSTVTRVTMILDTGSMSGSIAKVAVGPSFNNRSNPPPPVIKYQGLAPQGFAAGSETTVVYATRIIDTLDEYDPPTRRLTPSVNGYGWRHLEATVFLDTASANALYLLYLRDGGNTLALDTLRSSNTTDDHMLRVSTLVELTRSSSICVVFENGGGGAVSSQTGGTFFMAHRVG